MSNNLIKKDRLESMLDGNFKYIGYLILIFMTLFFWKDTNMMESIEFSESDFGDPMGPRPK